MDKENRKCRRRTNFFYFLLSSFTFVLNSTAFCARSIILEWIPSNIPGVMGYNVYCRSTGQQYGPPSFVRQARATISHLLEDTTYIFQVTAISGFGVEGTPSDEAVYSVPPLPSGVYNGLFFEADAVKQRSTGSFSISVTQRGTYTGQIRIGTGRYSFSGKLGENYEITQHISGPGNNPLTLTLRLGTGLKTDTVFGSLSSGEWQSVLLGDRAFFDREKNPATNAGNYTLVLPGCAEDPGTPSGDGYGTVKLNPDGTLRLAGCLADGTKITQSAILSKRQQWPLYLSLYSGKGFLVSWIDFVRRNDSDLEGQLSWIKQPFPSKTYPNGFDHTRNVTGSSYDPNLFFGFTDGTVEFRAGTALGVTNTVTIGPRGEVKNLNGPSLTMTFSSARGTFKGKTVDPITRSSMPFSGVVLQRSKSGRGFLVETNQSSSVLTREF